MWTPFGIMFSSFGIGMSGAMMPGPMLSVTVAESYRKGFWAGPLIVLGHCIPEIALMAMFSVGLNSLIDNDVAQGVLGIVGGLFLAGLAGHLLLEAKKGIEIDLGPGAEVGWGPFITGIWLSISNPGFIIWWATIGAKYIMLSLEHGMIGLLFFFIGHESSDLAWYSTVSYLVSRGRKRISTKVFNAVFVGCALLVLLFAGLFFVNGISSLVSG